MTSKEHVKLKLTFHVDCLSFSESYSWWPFFVTIFYLLAPIPMLLAKRYNSSGMGPSNPCQELAVFLTMGIVISAFGLPIVLARSPPDAPTVSWDDNGLTLKSKDEVC